MTWDPLTAQRVQARVITFLRDRTALLEAVSTEAAALGRLAQTFLEGGKKFRAQFCFLGWAAIGGTRSHGTEAMPDELVGVAAALEMFHAAALIHDDIIDNSDTRRGAPSAHRRFQAMHADLGYSGDPADFGVHAALLLGDLVLGWSDELFDESLYASGATISNDQVRAARREFTAMRTQVTAGQYLDVLEESAWVTRSDEDVLAQAERVIIYKSAKYSVEAPLCMGAQLAGASATQISALRTFGLPLGIAFQLRDDLLGVFGDPRVTGKPAGDDLREGKRTVLIGLARQHLTDQDRDTIDRNLGCSTMTADDVGELQRIITASGAPALLEARIAEHVTAAVAALSHAPFDDQTVGDLHTMAETVTNRYA